MSDTTQRPGPDSPFPWKIRHHYWSGGRGNTKPCWRCGQKRNTPIHFGYEPEVPTNPGPVMMYNDPPRQGNSAGQANRFRYAVVKPSPLPGSTLSSLSQIYYGRQNEWSRIYEANRKGKRRADGTPGLIENPNRLHIGWKLIIPR